MRGSHRTPAEVAGQMFQAYRGRYYQVTLSSIVSGNERCRGCVESLLLHQPADESDLEANDLHEEGGSSRFLHPRRHVMTFDARLPSHYSPIEFNSMPDVVDTPEPCRIHQAFFIL